MGSARMVNNNEEQRDENRTTNRGITASALSVLGPTFLEPRPMPLVVKPLLQDAAESPPPPRGPRRRQAAARPDVLQVL